MDTKRTGTKEWAKRNWNICDGCSHNCRYCYARHMKVDWFHQMTNWEIEIVNMDNVTKQFKKIKQSENGLYDFMFPTTHDITPKILLHCITVLKSILQAGNTVVIVTKPHLDCIQALTKELAPWKEQILIRMTITSYDNALLKFWEPNAPAFEERLVSLKYCFYHGYQTSISIEPALDIPNTAKLVELLEPYVTEKTWIGIMKAVKQRVKIITDEDRVQVDELLTRQQKQNVIKLHSELSDNKKIAWKDSIVEIINCGSGLAHKP